MTNRDIRAYLRAATRAKILSGWYVYRPPGAIDTDPIYGGLVFCIAPIAGRPQHFAFDEAIRYCEMLATEGIEPEYIDG